MAQLHRHGRVLPERPAANLDRLVCAASAALVSRFATGATLVLELGLVFMLFLPRRWRIVCFFIVTAWQIPVILTANYTFLNYLVLLLGFLLLDDRFICDSPCALQKALPQTVAAQAPPEESACDDEPALPARRTTEPPHPGSSRLALTSVILLWIFYSTTVQMIWLLFPHLPLPTSPVAALEPFRIANRYGLFAVMTRGRYEIEFQGSNDGQNWTAYPFRYKPQDIEQDPRIYAPYQPRFDWNLWFASLGSWRENLIVPSTEERLLAGARMCWRSSPAIHFRRLRRSRCAPCSGNTGSPRWRRSARPACGGAAICSGYTRRYSSASLTARLSSFSSPSHCLRTCRGRAGLQASVRGAYILN